MNVGFLLFTSQNISLGVYVRVRNLIEELVQKGINVFVFTPYPQIDISHERLKIVSPKKFQHNS